MENMHADVRVKRVNELRFSNTLSLLPGSLALYPSNCTIKLPGKLVFC